MTASKWREMVEQKVFRGKLWAASGMEQLVRKMFFPFLSVFFSFFFMAILAHVR